MSRSCSSYDEGYEDEAVRIATTIRVLIHDTQQSTSMLTHLDAKGIRVWSSVPDIPLPEEDIEVGIMFSLGLKQA